MNVAKILDTRAVAYVASGALLLGAVYVVGKRMGWWDALTREGAFNPGSDKNLAYGGVNAVGAAITGDPSWSLGSWAYDLFNPPYDPNGPAPPFVTRKVAIGETAKGPPRR